jgi:CheY-like chemotaxis protein
MMRKDSRRLTATLSNVTHISIAQGFTLLLKTSVAFPSMLAGSYPVVTFLLYVEDTNRNFREVISNLREKCRDMGSPYRVGEKAEPARPERIDCVFLTCFRADYSFLASVLQYSGVRMHRAETPEEADFLLTVTGATVLVSDVTFPTGTWRDALAMLAEVHPLIPALVAAEPVDRQYLRDVYTRGACGVLWKPIDFGEVIRMIRTADQAARDRAFFKSETALRASLLDHAQK